MSALSGAALKSFVVLPVGGRRFSFPAESVIELVGREEVQQFPHRTVWICGVIIRRGRAVPICNLNLLLGETKAPLGRFHLIVEWQSDSTRVASWHDWCAIPVAGECELSSVEQILAPDSANENPGDNISVNAAARAVPYITGFLQAGGERVAILDLATLIREYELSVQAATEQNA